MQNQTDNISPNPKFSVLIPATPKRITTHLIPLFNKLSEQVESLLNPKDVEILTFLDNKRRSIGYKRDALVQIARGRYLAFVDDDDQVSKYYIKEIVEVIDNHDVDVITFNQWCSFNNQPKLPVYFKLGHPVNEPVPGPYGATRPPWHICAWRTQLVQQFRFPDSMYGEDWHWCLRCNAVAKTSHHIDKFLHAYIFNDAVTEAV